MARVDEVVDGIYLMNPTTIPIPGGVGTVYVNSPYGNATGTGLSGQGFTGTAYGHVYVNAHQIQ